MKWDTEALSVGLFPAPCNYYCSSVKGPCPGSWRTTSCGAQTHAFDVRSVLCILSREKLCEDETPPMIWLPTSLHSSTATLTVHSSCRAHKGPPVIPDKASNVGSCWYPCRVTSRQVFTCHPVTQAARNQPSKRAQRPSASGFLVLELMKLAWNLRLLLLSSSLL